MAQKDSMTKMLGVLGLTCLIAGLCLAFTHALTKDVIANAELEAQLKSVREVLPEFEGEPEIKTLTIDGEERTVYIGKHGGRIVGVATTSSGVGYGGNVRLLVGIDTAGRITGIVIVKHQETPGLGTKAAEPSFLDQFKGKQLDAADAVIRVDKDGGAIDSVTAATITSRAVAEAATEALQFFEENKGDLL